MQVVATSSPKGPKMGRSSWLKTTGLLNISSAARDPYRLKKANLSTGWNAECPAQLQMAPVNSFDPCKSVFISVICGEVLSFLQTNPIAECK
jgi:hypothetical protein